MNFVYSKALEAGGHIQNTPHNRLEFNNMFKKLPSNVSEHLKNLLDDFDGITVINDDDPLGGYGLIEGKHTFIAQMRTLNINPLYFVESIIREHCFMMQRRGGDAKVITEGIPEFIWKGTRYSIDDVHPSSPFYFQLPWVKEAYGAGWDYLRTNLVTTLEPNDVLFNRLFEQMVDMRKEMKKQLEEDKKALGIEDAPINNTIN